MAANNSATPEMKETIANLRAIVISRKDATTPNDLIKDFNDLQGENIPYKKYGFDTLQQFLEKSNEFNVRKIGMKIFISVKQSDETKHLTNMLRKQKSTGKKNKFNTQRAPNSSYDQSWNKTPNQVNIISPKKTINNYVQQKNFPRNINNNYLDKVSSRSSGNGGNIGQSFNNKNSNQPNSINHRSTNNEQRQQQHSTVARKILPQQHLQQQFQPQQQQQNNNNKKYHEETSPPRNTNNGQKYQQNNSNTRKEKLSPKHQQQQQTNNQANYLQRKDSLEQIIQNRIIRKDKEIIQQPQNKQIGGQMSTRINLAERMLEFDNMNIKTPKDYLHLVIPTNNNNNNNSSKTKETSTVNVVKKQIKTPTTPPTPTTPTSIQLVEPKSLQNRLQIKRAKSPEQQIQQQPQQQQQKQLDNGQQQQINNRTLEITIPNQIQRNSLQDRLRIIKQIDINNTSSDIPITPPTPPTSITTPIFKNIAEAEKTKIDELDNLCVKKKLPKPIYKIFYIELSKNYQAKVTVNDSAYTTYPNEFPTEKEAKINVASQALEQIEQMELKKRYPICLDSDFNIVIKMHQQLLMSPHGVFRTSIPERFQELYEQSLPNNWFTLINDYPQFFAIEEGFDGNFIIFANVGSSGASSISSVDSDNTINEKLILPWSEKHWNLYISNPISTVEVWGRIIGPKYSDLMESLLTDIELSMLTDKQRAPTIHIGYIYLVSVSECWCRVRVDDIDTENKRALCFFVDLADKEWFTNDQLYICESRFLKLPKQAVKLCLWGLEDLALNPRAKLHLEEILSGKILIGEIMITKELYEMQEESDDLEPRLQVILYDTSSDDDVNLNPLILQKISKGTPAPELERTNMNCVNITHINDDGDIYCQVKNNELDYVQKLIHTFIKTLNTDERNKLMYSKKEKETNKTYLTYDENDKKWYRATIDSFGTSSENECQMNFIDYGIKRTVKTTQFLCLEHINVPLSCFPPQAIKIRLFGIPQMTENVIARLKGLIKPDTEAIIKVMSLSTVLQVNIYIRLIEKNIILPINEIIRLESEMELNSISTTTTTTTNLNNLTDQMNQLAVKSPMESPTIKSRTTPTRITPTTTPLTHTPISNLRKLDRVQIPKVGEFFQVHITMASNPNYFVIRPHSDGPKLHELMSDLQKYCTDSSSDDDLINVTSDNVEIDEYYAVLHDTDNVWYRCKVENIYGETMIHICYCDYGDVKVVGCDKLKILPEKFRLLPQQAVKAKLYGIKPTYGDWTMNDCMSFQKLTVNNTFYSLVKNIKIDELCEENIVELYLIDVSGPIDIFLHQILIDNGSAIEI